MEETSKACDDRSEREKYSEVLTTFRLDAVVQLSEALIDFMPLMYAKRHEWVVDILLFTE